MRVLNSCYSGEVIPVLIEGQASDIDGKVIINDLDGKTIEVGDLVYVEITEVLDYDLVRRIVTVT